MADSITNLISIDYRASKIFSGYEYSRKTLQPYKGSLILLMIDTSIQTKNFFYNKSKRYNIPLCETSLKDDLGKALGKPSLAVIVCTDASFAKAIAEKLTKEIW